VQDIKQTPAVADTGAPLRVFDYMVAAYTGGTAADREYALI
jgi:hypothetical protein